MLGEVGYFTLLGGPELRAVGLQAPPTIVMLCTSGARAASIQAADAERWESGVLAGMAE